MQYRAASPRMMVLHKGKLQFIGMTWAVEPLKKLREEETSDMSACREALTAIYFRHMFREGRVIVLVEGGMNGGREWKKVAVIYHAQSERTYFHGWLTNFLLYPIRLSTLVSLLLRKIQGREFDVHNCRPVVLEPEDAWRRMNPNTPVEEAAHIAQTRLVPTERRVYVVESGDRCQPEEAQSQESG